jgi:hypothetical protein
VRRAFLLALRAIGELAAVAPLTLDRNMDFSKQIAEDQRLLLADLHRRIEAALQPFANDLDDFLGVLFQARLPSDWRQRWHNFVAEAATKGFFVAPKSVVELEDWIEAWARFCGLLPRNSQSIGLEEFSLRPSVASEGASLVVHALGNSNRDGEEQLAQLSSPADRQPPLKGTKPRAASAPKVDKSGTSPKVDKSERSNNPPGVVTKPRLPAAHRGTWVQGTIGNGAFRFNDTVEHQKAGLAGKDVRFTNQYIAIGGFPPELYYGGSAESASVEIDVVRGTDADSMNSDERMRIKRRDPKWQRPAGYRWNHAGQPGSKVMELLDKNAHALVAHKGSAAEIRAQLRAAKGRAIAILSVYLQARDVLQTMGVLQPEYSVAERETYHFVADDGSVFVVWPAGWLSSPQLEFVSGPRQGQKEGITRAEVEDCRKKAEEVWGRYIPGSLLSQPRFIPGTERHRLPIIREQRGLPEEIGWIDEKGVHYYSVSKRIII